MPRLAIAGLSGGSGKTLVSLALLLEARRRGISVRAFKKGPDYIDAAWLSWAGERPARNLDTHLMGFDGAANSFSRNGIPYGLNIVEGNRGLFDGLDALGTHSTAELAKALDAPVVLVVDATKTTRTAAALALGCQQFDPAVRIAAVVLNRLGGVRHERVIREAIESACRIPVMGAIPRAPESALISMRHLGLTTPAEYPGGNGLPDALAEHIGRYLDFDGLLTIARAAPDLSLPAADVYAPTSSAGLTIGYVYDSAFSFYYPENLEALERSGARLEPISALTSSRLTDSLDALYIGGGFPETHAQALSENTAFLGSLRSAAEAGLPIYAECGGLMLLSRALTWRGSKHPMAGVFSFEVEVCEHPQGHGYSELLVDAGNPFFPAGARLRGHEFHYSRIVPGSAPPRAACAVVRGAGAWGGRDGLVAGNVWAAYTHLHALATPEWRSGMIQAARSARTAV